MAFPIDEKYISDVEEKIGTFLPDFYKKRMKKQNGGEVEIYDEKWNLFPIFDSSDKKRIKRTSNHILVETKSAREWQNFPPNAIAIGGNDYGDILVLVLDEKTNIIENAIFMWSHDSGNLEMLDLDKLK